MLEIGKKQSKIRLFFLPKIELLIFVNIGNDCRQK